MINNSINKIKSRIIFIIIECGSGGDQSAHRFRRLIMRTSKGTGIRNSIVNNSDNKINYLTFYGKRFKEKHIGCIGSCELRRKVPHEYIWILG